MGATIANAAQSMNPANKRILLVDDDATFRADMRGIFGDERNCEFIEADDGGSAIKLAREHPQMSLL